MSARPAHLVQQHPRAAGRAPVPGFPFIPPPAVTPPRPPSSPRPAFSIYWPAVWTAGAVAAVLLACTFVLVPSRRARPASLSASVQVPAPQASVEDASVSAFLANGTRVRFLI